MLTCIVDDQMQKKHTQHITHSLAARTHLVEWVLMGH